MTTFYPDDSAIESVALGVLNRTLPKPDWTHAAHFAAALWLLRHRPDIDLPKEMPGMIRAYNAATGTPNTDSSGYHETITQASIAAAKAVLGAHADAPLHLVLDRLMAGELGRSDWLLAYWRRESLFAVAARRTWVAPDLKPLPFPL